MLAPTPLALATLLPLLSAQEAPLRDLDAKGTPYSTPRSGEGVRASLFGSPLELPERDRRSVSAWEFGLAAAFHAEDSEAVPFGSLYFWEHPDDDHLLRASLFGVYNQVLWVTPGEHGTENILTFENYTLPYANGELVDGQVADGEKMFWGYVRGGIGVGRRLRVSPREQDNMLASDLLIEPGLLYFGRADTTDPGYQVPNSTAELRLRWILRYDALQRNLLELPHDGFAFGADAVYGYRMISKPWGPATDLHDSGPDYAQATAYGFLITGVPGLSLANQECNRIVASFHGGIGDGVDQFSAQRVGGGPDLRGSEYETSARPWLPGAGYTEFFPENYAIGSLGYRRELAFFAHLDAGGTLAWLDRDRLGSTSRTSDTLVAVSLRLSTGFVGRTMLQLGYGHNFDVVRDGERGGDEFTLMMTGRF